MGCTDCRGCRDYTELHGPQAAAHGLQGLQGLHGAQGSAGVASTAAHGLHGPHGSARGARPTGAARRRRGAEPRSLSRPQHRPRRGCRDCRRPQGPQAPAQGLQGPHGTQGLQAPTQGLQGLHGPQGPQAPAHGLHGLHGLHGPQAPQASGTRVTATTWIWAGVARILSLRTGIARPTWSARVAGGEEEHARILKLRGRGRTLAGGCAGRGVAARCGDRKPDDHGDHRSGKQRFRAWHVEASLYDQCSL